MGQVVARRSLISQDYFFFFSSSPLPYPHVSTYGIRQNKKHERPQASPKQLLNVIV